MPRNFIHYNNKSRKGGTEFWNNEYKVGGKNGDPSGHLALSTSPSEDLEKFGRYLERHHADEFSVKNSSFVDIGCGNGRNSLYMSERYGLSGYGFDISQEGIKQAKMLAAQKGITNITFEVGSILNKLPLPDESQTIVLDLMVSHFLNEAGRKHLLSEIVRVLKPGGWLYFKTFFKDGDDHAKRLLKDSPGSEPGSYIHPKIGMEEHVFDEEEIIELLSPFFSIEKISRSHRHRRKGQAFKRRSISVYAQKLV